MTTSAQIKKKLISRIQNSTDMDFLRALETILEASEESPFVLSPEQKQAIEEGRKQIRQGDYIENDKLNSEIEEWLSKK